MNISKFIIVFVFLLTSLIKVLTVSNGNFAFTTDQGRDMIDLRQIAVGHDLRLIGPTTSINGVFLGPFWYYFNLPAFILSNGDASFVLLWQIAALQLTGIFIYWQLSKILPKFSLVASVLYFCLPLGFIAARYSWNANAMIFVTAIFFTLYLKTLLKPTIINSVVLGLVSGLALQTEAAFGILLVPFAFSSVIIQRRFKYTLPIVFGFLVTLIPQFLFEIKHQFIMTKLLLAEFTTPHAILGESLSFAQRITDRTNYVQFIIAQFSHLPPLFVKIILSITALGSFIALFKSKKFTQKIVLSQLVFFLLVICFYLAFSKPLKLWYVYGLTIPLIFLTSSVLSMIMSHRFLKYAAFIVLILSVATTFKEQYGYLKASTTISSEDKSSYLNSLNTVRTAFSFAEGGNFKAYNFMPSIYDYPYQYLYWYLGKTEYKYVPEDIAYLPNQPEYITQRTAYFYPKKLGSAVNTILIIEDGGLSQNRDQFFNTFNHLCQAYAQDFDYGVQVRKLYECNP